MLTNRAEAATKFWRNLQFTVAANAKPSRNKKTPNANLHSGMVQLIPSSAANGPTLTQDPDDVAIVPISSIQPALDAITGIAISARAMPTTTIPAENKAQNVKMNIPIPTFELPIAKAVEKRARCFGQN